MGRRRRSEVKFSRANLLGMRQVVKTSSSLRRRRNSGMFPVVAKTVRDRYSILTSNQNQKLRDEENCLQNRIIQVAKKTLAIVDSTIIIAYRMQITDVFECHNKTVTRQSSSQRKIRRLSGKLHCLNIVFPVKNETLDPVCRGYETSSSSDSLSMLKFPTVSFETAIERRKFS